MLEYLEFDQTSSTMHGNIKLRVNLEGDVLMCYAFHFPFGEDIEPL